MVAARPLIKTVKIPGDEFGGQLPIRLLSLADRLRIQGWYAEAAGLADPQARSREYQAIGARTIALSLCDEDGTPAFDAEKADDLAELKRVLSGRAAELLTAEILDFNGMSEKAVTEGKSPSGTTQS